MQVGREEGSCSRHLGKPIRWHREQGHSRIVQGGKTLHPSGKGARGHCEDRNSKGAVGRTHEEARVRRIRLLQRHAGSTTRHGIGTSEPAIWVTDPGDHSEMLKAFVQEWVRVNLDGDTAREYFSCSASQRLLSRPMSQSTTCGPNLLGASLDPSSCATEDPSSGVFDLWDDMTLPEIFQRKS